MLRVILSLKGVLIVSLVTLLFGVATILVEIQTGAISASYNQTRPSLISGGGEQCLKTLKARGVDFVAHGTRPNGQCTIKNAVRISKINGIKLKPTIEMNCKSALATSKWLADINATRMTHIGTFNCRTQRGSALASEHSFGTAIDITSINGASVSEDWGKDTNKGRYLAKAYSSACRIFANVVGPDDNKAHSDHFHLDTGIGVGCLPDWAKKVKKFAYGKLRELI